MNFLSVTSLLFVSLNRPSNRAQNNRVFEIKIIRKPPMPYVPEVLNVHMNESKKNLLFFRTIFLQTVKIVYFDTRGQNGRLAHYIFTRAVSESPVWPHVSNHIFLYKFTRTRVGSPFTDIENAPQLNFTRQLSTRRY